MKIKLFTMYVQVHVCRSKIEMSNAALERQKRERERERKRERGRKRDRI